MRLGERGVAESWEGLDLAAAAAMEADAVLQRLGTASSGITPAEAARRLGLAGPNAILSHGAQPLRVLLASSATRSSSSWRRRQWSRSSSASGPAP